MRATALAVAAVAFAAATITAPPQTAAAPLADRWQRASADPIVGLAGRLAGDAIATIADTTGAVGGRPPAPRNVPASPGTLESLSGASQVFYDGAAGIVGFRDALTGLDILDTANPAFSGYGRSPSIGPVSSAMAVAPDDVPAAADETDPAADGGPVFATVLGGAPLAEPGVSALLAAGLVALLGLGRRRIPPLHAGG